MNVEIAYDALEFEYATQGSRLDPLIHALIWLDRPAWLVTLSRRADADLDVIRHKESGNFVLIQWVHRPGAGRGPGLFVEIHAFKTFEEFPGVVWLDRRLVPDHVMRDRMKKKVRETRAFVRSLKEDSYFQRQDTAKWLKRQGMDLEAKMIGDCMVPYMGDKEAEAKGCGGEL